jgi:hypothetical protein
MSPVNKNLVESLMRAETPPAKTAEQIRKEIGSIGHDQLADLVKILEELVAEEKITKDGHDKYKR